MSEQAFVRAASDLITAVDEAFKRPAPLPAFILLYSSIDIFASLTRPIAATDTSGMIFKNWVRKYMIGNDSFTWNEDDIWGARCGLLHTYTIQSRSSRGGTARELHYISDPDFAKFAQQQTDPHAQNKVIVCLPDLITAFIGGVGRFTMDVQNDPALQATVFHHAAKLIIHERHKNP